MGNAFLVFASEKDGLLPCPVHCRPESFCHQCWLEGRKACHQAINCVDRLKIALQV